MPTLPVTTVTRPAVLAGKRNGELPDSILVDTPGLARGPLVRLVAPAARAWRAMTAAAQRDGHVLKAVSVPDSYRDYATQRHIFTARYTRTFLEDRPIKRWDSDNNGTLENWYQRPGTAQAAVPGTCIEEGAIVLTRRGLIPIAEVHVGDEVWTHQYRWRPVTEVARLERPLVRIAGSGHPGIDVTQEHRWWVYDGWHRFSPYKKGIRHAGTDLKVRQSVDILGDLWLSPEYIDAVDAPGHVTEAWARWAGAWIADGSLHYVHGELTEGLIYPRNTKAEQIIEWAKAAGVTLTENADRSDGTRRLRFGREQARLLEASFGRLSKDRTIPVWLLAGAQKYGEPFLSGFLHGDGHRTQCAGKRPHWTFSTASRRLAVGLRLLAQGIGWHAYISGRRWAPDSVVKGKRCRATSETWFLAMYEHKPASGTRLWNHEGYVVGRVRRIADRGASAPVYDLTVAEDESFCVDGIFTHNSNHGWGLAVDIGEERDGDDGVESIDDGTVRWLINNAHRFGFSGEVQDEPWHWRYFAGDAIPAAVLAFEQGDDDVSAQEVWAYPSPRPSMLGVPAEEQLAETYYRVGRPGGQLDQMSAALAELAGRPPVQATPVDLDALVAKLRPVLAEAAEDAVRRVMLDAGTKGD